MNMNMTVFWVVAPCSLVKIYRPFTVLAASIIRAMSEFSGSHGAEYEITLFRDIAPFILVEDYRRFKHVCLLVNSILPCSMV
jgi:hypothetical protein